MEEVACRFNTKLLHGKTSAGYGQREILPPVSQVTAFQYESMEELEKCLPIKRWDTPIRGSAIRR